MLSSCQPECSAVGICYSESVIQHLLQWNRWRLLSSGVASALNSHYSHTNLSTARALLMSQCITPPPPLMCMWRWEYRCAWQDMLEFPYSSKLTFNDSLSYFHYLWLTRMIRLLVVVHWSRTDAGQWFKRLSQSILFANTSGTGIYLSLGTTHHQDIIYWHIMRGVLWLIFGV